MYTTAHHCTLLEDSCIMYTVNCQKSAVYCTLYSQLSSRECSHLGRITASSLYIVQCTMYSLQCTCHSVYCSLYTAHYELTLNCEYSDSCTVFSVQCLVYSFQCIVYMVSVPALSTSFCWETGAPPIVPYTLYLYCTTPLVPPIYPCLALSLLCTVIHTVTGKYTWLLSTVHCYHYLHFILIRSTVHYYCVL